MKKLYKILVICLVLCGALLNEKKYSYALEYAKEGKVLESLEIIDSASKYDELIKRVEVAAIISRLFENEENLSNLNISFEFTDVPNWGKKYVNYLYRNEIINGKSNYNFGSTENMKPHEFMTIILRILGYSDKKGDFKWNASLEKALEIELIDSEQYNEIKKELYISRNYVYLTLCNALFKHVNDVDVYLLESLFYNGNAIGLDEIKNLNTTEALKVYNKIKSRNINIDKTMKIKDKKTIFENNVSAIATLKLYSIEKGENVSQGTGFFIDGTGKIITNYHVISGKEYGVAMLANNAPYYITGVYDYDKSKDIAVLKVEDNKYPSLKVGDSNEAFIGQKIYTIGSPNGNANTISEGWIVNKDVRVTNMDISIIMATATIDSGASGSPVFDSYGKVIGIASSKISHNGKYYTGIIPINHIKDMNVSEYKRLYNVIDITNDSK